MQRETLTICDDCRRELWEPRSRRHRYFFTRCPACGPAWGLAGPDRPRREDGPLADFAMCPACEREVQEDAGRRLGDRACCCPLCGPSLHLVDPRGWPIAGDAARRAGQMLEGGSLLVVKGLRGFAFVASKACEEALQRIPPELDPAVPSPLETPETAFELLVRSELSAPLVLAPLPLEGEDEAAVRSVLDRWGDSADAYLVHNLPLGRREPT